MAYDYKKNEFTQKLPEGFLRKCAELMAEPDNILRGFIGDFAGYYLDDDHEKRYGCYDSGSDERDMAEQYVLRRGYGYFAEMDIKEAEAVIQTEVLRILPKLQVEWENDAKDYECPLSELSCDMQCDIEAHYRCIIEKKYPILLYNEYFLGNMWVFAEKAVKRIIGNAS